MHFMRAYLTSFFLWLGLAAGLAPTAMVFFPVECHGAEAAASFSPAASPAVGSQPFHAHGMAHDAGHHALASDRAQDESDGHSCHCPPGCPLCETDQCLTSCVGQACDFANFAILSLNFPLKAATDGEAPLVEAHASVLMTHILIAPVRAPPAPVLHIAL
ncbi:MAG: hypothetical protein Tsb008_04610 [Rhodothalassiaceae bacterium]